jgi:hypothetical protein
MRKLLGIASLLIWFDGSVVVAQEAARKVSGEHASDNSTTLSAPADLSAEPRLYPDSLVVGSPTLPPHSQPRAASVPLDLLIPTVKEKAVDRAINNICRGC